MQHHVGVLGVVDAAVAEVQGVVGVGVERVVGAVVVDVDRDRAVVGVREAQALDQALGAGDRGVDARLLEAVVAALVVVVAGRRVRRARDVYGRVPPWLIPGAVRSAKSPFSVFTDPFRWVSGNPVIRLAVSFAVSASPPSWKAGVGAGRLDRVRVVDRGRVGLLDRVPGGDHLAGGRVDDHVPVRRGGGGEHHVPGEHAGGAGRVDDQLGRRSESELAAPGRTSGSRERLRSRHARAPGGRRRRRWRRCAPSPARRRSLSRIAIWPSNTGTPPICCCTRTTRPAGSRLASITSNCAARTPRLGASRSSARSASSSAPSAGSKRPQSVSSSGAPVAEARALPSQLTVEAAAGAAAARSRRRRSP